MNRDGKDHPDYLARALGSAGNVHVLAILEKGKLLRHGKTADVMRDAGHTRRITLRLAAPSFGLDSWLASRPDISELHSTMDSTSFAFPGDNSELAVLVRDLVNAGAPVCAIEETVESLEQLFSRLSSGEVM